MSRPSATLPVTRRTVLCGAAAFGLATALPVPAAARSEAVDGPAALARALGRAGPGTVLSLAPGVYGKVAFRSLRGTPWQPVILRSADPSRPARLNGLAMRLSGHVRMEGLVFDYRFTPGDAWNLRPFLVQGCRDVTIAGCLFEGDDAHGETVKPHQRGHGWAFGLFMRGGRDLAVEDCEVRGYARGLTFRGVEGLRVTGNHIHDLSLDGMTFAQVSDTLIENNRIHAFRRAAGSGAHPDMIQFWTASTTAPSRNVTIRRNLLNSGNGPWTQTIFMRNGLVDTGKAGEEMFYRDLVIEENVIVNAHPHGITVGAALGLDIRNNTLIRNRRSAGTRHRENFYIPGIRVNHAARDVRILRNVTPRIFEPKKPVAGWEVRGNLLIQDERAGARNHYDTLFVNARAGDPAALDNFRYRRGGPLDGAGIGASRLAPAGRAGPGTDAP